MAARRRRSHSPCASPAAGSSIRIDTGADVVIRWVVSPEAPCRHGNEPPVVFIDVFRPSGYDRDETEEPDHRLGRGGGLSGVIGALEAGRYTRRPRAEMALSSRRAPLDDEESGTPAFSFPPSVSIPPDHGLAPRSASRFAERARENQEGHGENRHQRSALWPCVVALIDARPSATPFTSPFGSTVAIV